MKQKKSIVILDQSTNAAWSCAKFEEIGPTLGKIRSLTAANHKYTKGWKPMTRFELMVRINNSLRGNEREITVNVIRNLESGKLVYGGYMMRIAQVARALLLDLKMSRK